MAPLVEWGLVLLVWIPIVALVATFYAYAARFLLRKANLSYSDRLTPYFLVLPALILLSILSDPWGLAAAWKMQALEGFLQTTLGGAFYPLNLIDALISWWNYYPIFFVIFFFHLLIAKKFRSEWYARTRKPLWLSFRRLSYRFDRVAVIRSNKRDCVSGPVDDDCE
jgi:hypothetical protein